MKSLFRFSTKLYYLEMQLIPFTEQTVGVVTGGNVYNGIGGFTGGSVYGQVPKPRKILCNLFVRANTRR